MQGQFSGEISALELAGGLRDIYAEFTDSVRALGGKAKGKKYSGKMGESFAHWIGGAHVTTDREQLCQKFLRDVQERLELLSYALEGLDEESVARACGVAADVMMEPVPAKSDSTTDLMRRAMVGQILPFLPHLSAEKLTELKQQLDAAYTRWQRLPVEREVGKELTRLIDAKKRQEI